jgi:hypothetical protein
MNKNGIGKLHLSVLGAVVVLVALVARFVPSSLPDDATRSATPSPVFRVAPSHDPGTTPVGRVDHLRGLKVHWHLARQKWTVNGLTMGMVATGAAQMLGASVDRGNGVRTFAGGIGISSPAMDDGGRVIHIWGTQLSARGRVILRAGDSRAKVLRLFGNKNLYIPRPHPPQSNEWRDIYWSMTRRTLVEDPRALEMIHLDTFVYGTTTATTEEYPHGVVWHEPDTATLYVCLVNDKMVRVNEMRNWPIGKMRNYINP